MPRASNPTDRIISPRGARGRLRLAPTAPARPLPGAAGVVRGIVEQSYSLDALRASIARCAHADDAHFLVAETAGRIVGFLHYDCERAEPELHRIYLDTAEKRKGIGSLLLGELHARLGAGASYILMVIADNHPAVAFYRRRGLVEQARVDEVEKYTAPSTPTSPTSSPPTHAATPIPTLTSQIRAKGGERLRLF